MNYRKQKKFYSKLLRKCQGTLNGNPLNATANGQVKYILNLLAKLKQNKKLKAKK